MDCILTGTISQEVQMYDGAGSSTFTGNGTDYIYIHDSLQAEKSSFATSRIKGSMALSWVFVLGGITVKDFSIV